MSCSGEIALISAIESRAQKLIDELRPIHGRKKSTFHSFRAAAQQIWKQSEIKGLEDRLERYRSDLALRLVAAINEQIGNQDEKITEILSLNRSIASWIQPQAAIVTRGSGKTETLIRPKSLRDWTGQQATDSENAISFRGISSRTATLVDQTQDEQSRTTFDFAFSSVETTLLYALRFRNIDARQQAVVEAHDNTFQWIFDECDERSGSCELLEWLRHGRGCFWISGKAGAGKSSLMKLVAHHRQLKESLFPWVDYSESGGKQLIIASFFIYRYAEHLQNSQEGLLRALLYQILDQRKDLIPIAFPSLCRTLSATYTAPASLSLTLDELKAGFRLLVRSLPDSVQLFLIIDGIDEYTGEYRDLIQLFQDTCTHESIKALISSRPIPSCESAFNSGPHLRLQDLTKPDILHYVRDKLEANRLMEDLEASEPGITREIADSVVGKASGVFLWVTLVVGSLLIGLENFDYKKDLLARIDELPSDLEKLYSFMMGSVSERYQRDASLMLQLVNRSRQVQDEYPLTVLQLSFAEDAELGDEIEGPSDPLQSAEVLRRCKKTEGRMRSRCCGLIEAQTVISRSPCCEAATRELRVNYLHRSVVEFLEISEVWDAVKSTNPLSQQRLDQLLLHSIYKQATLLGVEAQTQCQHQDRRRLGYNHHKRSSDRPVHSGIYAIRYCRSQGDSKSGDYVAHLESIRGALRKAPGLYRALADVVDRTLPKEGLYLQGGSDCAEGFLLYAAANGLEEFVFFAMRQSSSHRPGISDLRILLLYLLTNINNESSGKLMSSEERRLQIHRLARSAVSILRSGVNPNDAGLYWPDIQSAAVTQDIKEAVLRAPKQDHGLLPWIYWLMCFDPKSELFMGEKMCYYEILEEMIIAGADVSGSLGGGGKGKLPIMSLVNKTLAALQQQDPVEYEMLGRIRRHLHQIPKGVEESAVQKPVRKRDRLSSMTKSFSRIRVTAKEDIS